MKINNFNVLNSIIYYINIIIIYMYFFIIIFIIIGIILLLDNKTIEGQNDLDMDSLERDELKLDDQELEDKYRNMYSAQLSSDDIKLSKIDVKINIDNYNMDKTNNKEVILNVYLIDTIEEIKDKLVNKTDIPKQRMELLFNNFVLRDGYLLLEYGIKSGDTVQLTDSINIISNYGKPESRLYNILYSYEKEEIDSFDKFLKDFEKYNKTEYKESDKIYSKYIYSLFKNKSKPLLSTYNKNRYLSDKLNEKLKKEGDNVGPNGYIYSPDLYNRIIQDSIEEPVKQIEKKEECCYKTQLDIENPKIIKDFINIFRPELSYEQSIYGDFEPNNENYYKYMKYNNNIYNNMYGSMINYDDPGSLNP